MTVRPWSRSETAFVTVHSGASAAIARSTSTPGVSSTGRTTEVGSSPAVTGPCSWSSTSPPPPSVFLTHAFSTCTDGRREGSAGS
ncbi:hypothetical protein AMK29_30365 [Streptomyces sp. CB02261]|nr:hypothetical protein AMK29_30365 [Streptomyces sp. CB02261]